MADAPAAPDAFDPLHVLDGWRAPAPASPVDVDLGPLLRASVDATKQAWLKTHGYEMRDLQDVDIPDIAPPAPVELPTLPARTVPDPRLLARWQPRAWTALVRRLAGASADIVQTPAGPQVENRAPQWLCALWPPQRVDMPLLGRWPELAALVVAETAPQALQQLLPALAPDARLWLADLDVDWALVAELVLHQDASLRPAQAQALRDWVAAERSASFTRLNEGYSAAAGVARRRA
jgi:hypothetical protein